MFKNRAVQVKLVKEDPVMIDTLGHPLRQTITTADIIEVAQGVAEAAVVTYAGFKTINLIASLIEHAFVTRSQ